MTEEERTEVERIEANHSKPRWSWLGAAFCVLLAVGTVASVAAAAFSRSGAASSAEVKEGQELDRENRERTDCRSAYNARITEVIRRRDSLNTTFNVLLGTALFDSTEGIRSTPEQIAVFGQTKRDLAAAQAEVDHLPALDDAVNDGFVLGDVQYPPCPG